MIPFRDFVESLDEEDFLRLKRHIDDRYEEDFADSVPESKQEEDVQGEGFFELIGCALARFFGEAKKLFYLLCD